ncbi:MAG TPA: hypothetical protein VFB12_03175 [Ktedonobacteraceae bacterium]|nr:hypothetical protein [Ktedonobacteraceae bacterium]
MECYEPGAIRDEELVAYLEGEKVRPAVLEHLALCQKCSSQLATYRRINLKLIRKLYRWDCPPNQILGEYQLGLLSSAEAAEVKNHLRSCVLCAAEVTALTEFLANDPVLVERAPVSQIGVSVQTSSLNNHHSGHETKQTLDQLLDRGRDAARRIIATLLPPQPRLAYQRDAAQQAAQWPRRYVAENVSISIQVERSPNRKGGLQLIGFVTCQGMTLEALQGIPVQLSSQANAVYTQNIDELGNFVFSSLTPALYTLELQFPEETVVVDQIPITSQE